MKIYRGRIPVIADEIARKLVEENAVEVLTEEREEFRLDIESVLKSYIDTERRVHEEAQDVIGKRGLDFSSLNRIKRDIAKKYNFAIGYIPFLQ